MLGERGLRVLSFCCGELEQDLDWVAVRGLVAQTPAPGDLCAGVRAVFGLISRLAEPAPLLLVLDDAQWCDAPSPHALTYLQRRLHALPVGLVVAARSGAGAVQRALLERLQAGPDTEVHWLRPLSPPAVMALVRGWAFAGADPAFCDDCHRLTAGYPFYLRELLAECLDRGIDPRRAPAELASLTPPNVLSALLVRLERLPTPGAVPLARAAAVLGDGASLCHAAALAGVDDAGAPPALDALSGADLLCAGEPLRFVHPLVRTGIYAAIPPAQRAAQHGRAADLLRAGHAPVELVADICCTRREPGARPPSPVCGPGPRGREPRERRQLRRDICPARWRNHRGRRIAPRSCTSSPMRRLALGDPACVARLTEALEPVGDDRHRAGILRDLGLARQHAGRFGASADAFERGLTLAQSLPDETLTAELEGGYLASARFDARRVGAALRRIDDIARRSVRIDGGTAGRSAQVLVARTMAAAPRAATLKLAERLWADGGLLRDAGADAPSLWAVIGALSWGDA
jgi:hypothetical protein